MKNPFDSLLDQFGDPQQNAFDQIANAMPQAAEHPLPMPELAPPDLLTPENQRRMIDRAPEAEHKVVTSDLPEIVRNAVSKAEPATNIPKDAKCPILQLTGDMAVAKEFLAQLKKDGLVTNHPTIDNFKVVHASNERIAHMYNQAAEAVALREGRTIVSGVVQADGPKPGGWHGGMVLGAAESNAELHKQAARQLIASYPDTAVAKVINQAARDPAMMVNADGLDKASLRQLLEKYVEPHAAQGRSAALAEVATLTTNVEFLAKTLGENDSVAKKALAKSAFLDQEMHKTFGDKYEQLKAVMAQDLLSAQVKNLERAGVEVDRGGIEQQSGLKLDSKPEQAKGPAQLEDKAGEQMRVPAGKVERPEAAAARGMER